MYYTTEPTDGFELTTAIGDDPNSTSPTWISNSTWPDPLNSTWPDPLNSTWTDSLNSTWSTSNSSAVYKQRKLWLRVAIITLVYLVGIVGNATAIVFLRIGERRVRNRKHLLLLTSLATNDLVALLGMLALMVLSVAAPGLARTQGLCAGRVVLRVFGIGSVCIAVTMALERYLALTRPFLYQKQVTYYIIRLALLVSWAWAALLTCAPVVGVGLYYNAEDQRCERYRNARTPLDFGYAVFYVAFGTLLCVVLVYCNMAVIRALYAITSPRAGAVVRRVSRKTCRDTRDRGDATHNAATAEEVAFSRLMATLSVLFMVCWLPQMVTSALFLFLGPESWGKLAGLGEASDVLMLLNYVLNPLLYVLARKRRLTLAALTRCAVLCFKRKHKSSRESGSCCMQETTVVVSDSGGELRPLAPPHVPTARLLPTD